VKRHQMGQAPYFMDKDRRITVRNALREVCIYRGWNLWAAHVRTNHVHAVVEAHVRPEKVMNAFKSYASRGLNRLSIDAPERKR
jgi:REP element-mobilizing transposase RayT